MELVRKHVKFVLLSVGLASLLPGLGLLALTGILRLNVFGPRSYVAEGQARIDPMEKYLWVPEREGASAEYESVEVRWVKEQRVGTDEVPQWLWRLYFPEGLPKCLRPPPTGIVRLRFRYAYPDPPEAGMDPAVRVQTFEIVR